MIIIQSQNSGSFIGVALKYSGWEKGQVIYEFEFQNDTSCNVTTYSRYKEIKPAKGIATLHNNRRFLEIHDDTYFTRETDSETYDRAALMTYSPQFPNGTNTYFVTAILSDSTFYIRIPGFDGFKEQIETNLKKYAREISERPNMIIDIRNNGGGQDDEFQMLCDLIYTDPYESKNVEWYATKANIKIFEDVLVKGETDEEGIAWTKALLTEMKKNRGGFVVHPFSKNEDTMISSDTVYANPERIGIIINEGNGSSAEQFLLAAIESKKVTLFGTSPTAGVLDYSNAIGVDFPSGRYVLTIPMTRSQRLPENPIDNIGIKPDVIIPFPPTQQLYNKLDVWIEFVKNYLEIQK